MAAAAAAHAQALAAYAAAAKAKAAKRNDLSIGRLLSTLTGNDNYRASLQADPDGGSAAALLPLTYLVSSTPAPAATRSTRERTTRAAGGVSARSGQRGCSGRSATWAGCAGTRRRIGGALATGEGGRVVTKEGCRPVNSRAQHPLSRPRPQQLRPRPRGGYLLALHSPSAHRRQRVKTEVLLHVLHVLGVIRWVQ